MQVSILSRIVACAVLVTTAGFWLSASASAATIAIIGTDSVAAALGPEFAALGHDVVYGSRNPDRDSVRELVRRTGDTARATGQREAAAGADVVVLAVPWNVIEEVVGNLGDLAGKIIIDPTNPRVELDDGLRWHAREESNAEILQQLAPGAFVVKAFNTMSASTMSDPDVAGGPVSVPIVGNDGRAKQVVAGLIAGIGLEPVDLGPVRYARLVEGMYYLRSNARMDGRPFNYYLRPYPDSSADFTRLEIRNPAWTTPFPPVRIVGNLFLVGTYELASFLIATPAGHILVNTGAYGSEHLIRANVEALGYDFDAIEILLTTQAHWDHVGDLAAIKRQTGAKLYAHSGDAPVLENGGATDFIDFGGGAVFEPVAVDRVLADGDTIALGGTELTLLHHPGHTKGASSFSFTVPEGARDYDVLIVNMGTLTQSMRALGMQRYPDIGKDFAATFEAQKKLTPDIWVSSHARHFGLHDKYVIGDPYDPARFLDPDGYLETIEAYERRFLEQQQKERIAEGSTGR